MIFTVQSPPYSIRIIATIATAIIIITIYGVITKTQALL